MRPDQQHREAERAVDVLLTMQRSHNTARLTAEEFPNSVALADQAADTKLAMDDVAEYIAANDEYDAANKRPHFGLRTHGDMNDWLLRKEKAGIRRALAHARMKGGVR